MWAAGVGAAILRPPRPGDCRRRQRAAAGGVRAGQAWWWRAEFFLGCGSGLCVSAGRPVRWCPPVGSGGIFCAAWPAAGQAARRNHRRWIQPSRGSASAPVRHGRARGFVVHRHGPVLPARRTRLGALCLAQGARGGRRYRRRRSLAGDAAPLRLPALSGLHRTGRPARDEGGDHCRSRPPRSSGRHQARAGRHPRDRVPGAIAAVDSRWARTEPARASPAACPTGAGGGRPDRCGQWACIDRGVSLLAPARKSSADVARRTDPCLAAGPAG